MPTSVLQRIKNGQQPVSTPLSLAAPLGGWNTRDELDAMDPLDAVTLDNFFPDVTGVTVRDGSLVWATGLGTGHNVETLAEFRSGATDKLLAACNGSVFDVTSSGAVGAALGTGFSSNRWQSVNFLNYLFLANGVDTMQTFDGTTLANSTFTGVMLSTLIGCFQYQQRLFFWPANSLQFYYAPLNSRTGTLTAFDLSPFSPRGGSIIGMTSSTHDGGNGVLDFASFILSSGDLLMFYGNDPSLAANWQLIGRYRIAGPVNIRSICQYGAESFVATFDDYVPIEQQLVALKLGQLPPRSKISGALQAAIAANPNGFGWQALYYPKGRRLIFNVPNLDGTFSQHVCNTALPKQPWCRFTGMNASCWGLLGNNLFFGGANGTVYQADIGDDDSGTPISATAQQAWNREQNAWRKRMTAVRPVVQSSQGTYTFGVGFDYATISLSAPPPIAGQPLTDDGGVPLTDDSGNDLTAGAAGITSSWSIANGNGTAFSFQMTTSSAGTTSWLRTDFRLEGGQAL